MKMAEMDMARLSSYSAKIFCGVFLAALSSVSFAVGAESLFYVQCHKLLPTADQFAADCLQRARPFSRTFYPSGGSSGEFESYSAYFRTLDATSHFLLGCVLDFKHKINFVGLYYSALPLDMSDFAKYKIAFIDPNDNVGLELDGSQNTLLAIRQFVTDVIPYRLKGRPKNCEDAHIETISGVDATTTEHFREIDADKFEYCIRAYCQLETYSVFFGLHRSALVYAEHDLILIDGDGILMIKAKYYQEACATWKGGTSGAYNIIFEMCAAATNEHHQEQLTPN
jgi:hypothetical protein